MAAAVRAPSPVVAATPTDRAHFFGFHDVTPWAPNDELLAVLRVDPSLRGLPDGSDVAEVCVWHPSEGRIERVAETTAWNFQMGARVQWLPDGRLVYNTVSDGRLVAEALDLNSGRRVSLAGPVGAVSPDGSESISPHFGRLARYWPAYGVAGTRAPGLDDPAPASDGLWRLDLETNRSELLLPLSELAARVPHVPPRAPQFVTHPAYNPSGTRFVFMHRFFTGDGALYSNLLVADRDGSNLSVLAHEKVSHFDWLDDDTLVVWTRFFAGSITALRRSRAIGALRPVVRVVRHLYGRGGNAFASEGYYRISVETGVREPIAQDLLSSDGHPMFARSGRWMITDTYPNRSGEQELMLFDMPHETRYDLGTYRADPSLSSDLKCDLHPRWDRGARRVCIDSTDAGVRQCLIVDVSALTDAGSGSNG